MSLTGKFLVLWLAPESVETFLGILDPDQEGGLASWTVAGQVTSESPRGSGSGSTGSSGRTARSWRFPTSPCTSCGGSS